MKIFLCPACCMAIGEGSSKWFKRIFIRELSFVRQASKHWLCPPRRTCFPPLTNLVLPLLYVVEVNFPPLLSQNAPTTSCRFRHSLHIFAAPGLRLKLRPMHCQLQYLLSCLISAKDSALTGISSEEYTGKRQLSHVRHTLLPSDRSQKWQINVNGTYI
jgi:hypothetical protein